MNFFSTKILPNELVEVEQKLKEFFETLSDKNKHEFKRSTFNETDKTLTVAYDYLNDRGYSGKDLVLNLQSFKGKEIDHTVVDVRGSWQRENQRIELFSLDIEINSEIYEKVQAILSLQTPTLID